MELEKAGEPVLRSPTAHTVSKQQGSLLLWVHVVDIDRAAWILGQMGAAVQFILVVLMLLQQCHSGISCGPCICKGAGMRYAVNTCACWCAGDHSAAGQNEAAQEQAEQDKDSRGAGEA